LPLALKIHQELQGRSICNRREAKKMELLHQKRFFRPDEAAAILVISRRTVYRMIRDGRIPGIKWGCGPWRIPRQSLVSLLPGEKF
jgi:excisionase family DNA binding protein